ncbi:MAG: HK97 gp10 family phage protein [Candidatus Nitrosocosmicus sp.]|nr:HK97 gp10 family phage protein [Candidatus Nitrosocosmicus sp.]
MSFLTIEGIPQLTAYVDSLKTNLRKDIQNQVATVMQKGADRIQNDAPVRTGELRRSVRFSMGSGKGVLARIDISAGHAGFVNFGTIRMPPRPFASNGFNWIISQLKKG